MGTPRESPRPPVVDAVITLGAYAFAVYLGTALIVPISGVSALWLANGVAVAALLRQGRSRWIPRLLGLLPIGLAVRLALGIELEAAVPFMVGDLIDILVTLLVLRFLIGARSTFKGPAGILALFGAASAGAAASAFLASVGATPSAGIEPVENLSFHAALMWFIGRTVGCVLVVSLVDAWRSGTPTRTHDRRRYEAMVAFLIVVLTGGVGEFVPVAGTLAGVGIASVRTLGLFLFPIRYGRRATATLMAVLIYEFTALLVVGHVSVFGFRLVWVESPSAVIVGAGVAEAMLSLFTIQVLTLGLAALMAERRATADRLHQNEQRFQALAESAVDGIVEVSLEGEITFANDAAKQMFQVDDLVGAQISSLVRPPDQMGQVLDLNGTGLVKTRPQADVGRRGDGSTFPLSATWWTFTTASGRTAASAILRDESERMLEEEAREKEAADLERSNADLAEFAYVASHDLQEPLRMVVSFLRLLSERYHGKLDADADQFIGYAMDGAERLSTLVADLLTYSRAGTVALERRAVPLGPLVEESMDLLRMQMREKHVEVVLDELPSVRVNSSLVGLVMQNLLSNAMKFGPPEGPAVIEITWIDRPDGPEIRVIDHGIGIPEDRREQVFQPFRRLHARDQYPGNGIGLAVCRKIIERHGGRIWIEPTLGGGTTMCFTLGVAAIGDKRETVDVA